VRIGGKVRRERGEGNERGLEEGEERMRSGERRKQRRKSGVTGNGK